MNRCPVYRTCALALALAITMAATAQEKSSKSAPIGDGITARYVKTGLFVVSGEGGNSVLRLSANGLILVDGELPGNFTAVLRQIRKIDKQPLRVLVLTSADESRIGANQDFLASGAPVVVQQNAKLNRASVQAASDKAPPAADNQPTSPGDDDAPSPSGNHSPAPTVTYDREYKIHLGGVDVQLLHFGNAHTGADTVVYFPNLKAVAVGDLFASAPDPNYAAGGSLVGWGPVLAQVLKLDFDTAVPSQGPTVTRAEVEAFKGKIDILVSRAGALVSKGVPEDQLMSQLKTDDLGWKLNFTPAQVEGFYAELSKSGQSLHAAELKVPAALQK
jgi:glyoxylase-like metal-dependent hydrolase (beta-lactamase superfamily II)